MSLILVVLMGLQGAASGAGPPLAQLKPPAFTLDGYVLQVGAYQDETTAKAVVAEIGGKRMFMVPIRRDQQNWYVVLYDNFPTRESAELAAEQFKRDFPRQSSWIRDATQLRKVVRLGSTKGK